MSPPAPGFFANTVPASEGRAAGFATTASRMLVEMSIGRMAEHPAPFASVVVSSETESLSFEGAASLPLLRALQTPAVRTAVARRTHWADMKNRTMSDRRIEGMTLNI